MKLFTLFSTQLLILGNFLEAEVNKDLFSTFAITQALNAGTKGVLNSSGLPLEVIEGDRWIQHTYNEKQQLIRKITGHNNSILKREFFAYDTSGALVMEIVGVGLIPQIF